MAHQSARWEVPRDQGQASAPGTPSSCSKPLDWGHWLGVSSPLALISRSLGECGPGRWAVTTAVHTEARPASRAPTSACEILIPRNQGAGRVGSFWATRKSVDVHPSC